MMIITSCLKPSTDWLPKVSQIQVPPASCPMPPPLPRPPPPLSAPYQVKSAKTDAAAEVRGKLDSMYKAIDDMHALREGVLGELLAMQTEVFNEKMLGQMTRMIRDKEVSTIRKVGAAGLRSDPAFPPHPPPPLPIK